jgi:autotransporter-associated beta strand protein
MRGRLAPATIVALAVFGSALAGFAVGQEIRYWDIDGPTPGAGGPTPSGTWSSAAANWSPSAAGDATTEPWVSGTGAGDGNVAFFSAGSDATGSFTVTIDGTNFASGMVVNQGTVNLAGSGFVGIGSGTVTVRPGTTLGINNQSRVTQSAGGLLVLDGGTLLMANTGNAGSLWTSLGAGILLTGSGGTVNYNVGNNVTIFSGAFLGEGGTTTNGGAQTLTKTGTSELRVQGAQTANYTIAKLNILGGLYRIGSSTNASGQLSTETGFGAIPFGETPDAITLDGGAIGVSTNISTDPFRGITLGSNGGVINATSAALTLNGPITGPGALRAIGNRGITLTNANTATGGVIIGSDLAMVGGITTTTGGTLTINTDSNLGAVPGSVDPANVQLGTATAPGQLNVNATTLFPSTRGFQVGGAGGTLSNVGAATVTLAGPLSGTGGFIKTSSGTLVLSGSNTISGGITSWGGGMLEVSSDANLGAVSGTLQPAALTLAGATTSGRVRATETFTMHPNRGITINVGGTTATPLGGTIDVAADKTLTVPGPIAGGGRLTKAGAGTLVLAGSSSYLGTTSVSAGTLVVNGVIGGTSAVSLSGGATLAGSGTVTGPTTIGSFATVSPGASPGTLTFGGNLLWNSGGSYNWQLLSATGTAGQTSAWDLITVGGTLDIGATSANPFAVNLWTLSSILPDVSGSASGFDPAQNYTWRIASAAGGITGFAADKFVIGVSSTNGTGGFANDLAGGTFSLAQSGNDLNLVFSASGGPPTVITIDVASGTQTQTQAGYPTLSGSIPVLKTGAGTLVLDQANTLSGSTTVQGGVLQLANGSALSASRLVVVAGGTGQVAPVTATSVASLDLASGNGLLDLTSGALTISSGMTATELVAEILEGRGDGNWTGTSGITSSTAAAESAAGTPRSVGWIDNGDGSLTTAYAAPGDTNIDWSIDILDAANFLSGGKFDTGSPAVWFEGDFSYDGIVDILDAADFFATGLYDAGNYNTAPGLSGGVAAVPEPATTGALAVAVAGMAAGIGRRRRRG